MDVQTVYLNHDNVIDIILEADNTAVDISAATALVLSFGTVAIRSTNSTAQFITWNGGTWATGEVRFNLGKSTKLRDQVGPGSYKAWLTVYDPLSTAGLIWGQIPMIVKGEVEGV